MTSLATKEYTDYKATVEKVAAQENSESVLTEEIKLKSFHLVIDELFEVTIIPLTY